jgi:hypothetical protein
MTTLRFPLALLLLTGVWLKAQEVVATAPPADAAPLEALRTPGELEQLLAPIALYPDALIALILPASTAPADIVLAARHVRDHPNDRSQIEHRAWDESVKSLTHYPDVLKWMDENLHWTKQVGEAFLRQPADVMQAVQRLRAKAHSAGTLASTPQQQVIAEPEIIRIVPAQPNVIYVPYYEPDVVFVDRPVYYTRPFLTFGIGMPVGSWLAYDCDWRRRTIWVGDRHRHWTGHDWHRPLVPIAPGFSHVHTHPPGVRQWRPPVHVSRPHVTVTHPHVRHEIARPSPVGVPSTRSYVPRSPVVERRSPSHSVPVVNPLPRTFTQDSRREWPGPRATPATVSPAEAAPPPPVSAPTSVTRPGHSYAAPSQPNARRTVGTTHPGEAARERDSRSRSYQAPATRTPPPATVPALPMANPSRVAPTTGPVAHRVYSRETRVATPPAAVPALPMANSARVPPTTGPVATRSFSRPVAAPAVVPALPTAQAAAPAVAAPAPAAAPHAAPASPARSRGEGGSRRGGGRSELNHQER